MCLLLQLYCVGSDWRPAGFDHALWVGSGIQGFALLFLVLGQQNNSMGNGQRAGGRIPLSIYLHRRQQAVQRLQHGRTLPLQLHLKRGRTGICTLRYFLGVGGEAAASVVNMNLTSTRFVGAEQNPYSQRLAHPLQRVENAGHTAACSAYRSATPSARRHLVLTDLLQHLLKVLQYPRFLRRMPTATQTYSSGRGAQTQTTQQTVSIANVRTTYAGQARVGHAFGCGRCCSVQTPGHPFPREENPPKYSIKKTEHQTCTYPVVSSVQGCIQVFSKQPCHSFNISLLNPVKDGFFRVAEKQK